MENISWTGDAFKLRIASAQGASHLAILCTEMHASAEVKVAGTRAVNLLANSALACKQFSMRPSTEAFAALLAPSLS